MTMAPQFRTWSLRQYFWLCFFSLLNLSFMTIFFYKGFKRNLEIWKKPIEVLPNIWRLGRVKNANFGTNVSYKTLLSSAKCQGYCFYCFWVIKGKPRGGGEGGKITASEPCKTTPKFLEKIPTDLIVTCRTG